MHFSVEKMEENNYDLARECAKNARSRHHVEK
jgi:hypothetical protein